MALSGGNNFATTLFLNASPYRAIVHPYRPQVQDYIEATTILTRGDLKGYATMGELTVGLAEYFAFYNSERPHQSLDQKTPEVVYRTGIGGGATIVDKFPRAEDSSTAEAKSEATARTKARAKPGQRRSAASEVECTA